MNNDLINTYWNHNGKYQWMVDELRDAMVSIKGSTTYYRYYNDGDTPHLKGFNDPLISKTQYLEQWMDANVLETYAQYIRKMLRK